MAEILYNLFKAFTWITYTLCKLLIELYSQFKIYPIHNMNPIKGFLRAYTDPAKAFKGCM